ncbi:MAG: pentapeptide repeat-containing protein [Bacteroidales bacterium]|nr:pentapeptide repeat-containing protein [Bacteroidales bacterium]
MMRRSFFCVLMLALMLSATLSGCGDSPDAASGDTISADKILKLIRQGKPVQISNKRVKGKLDFTNLAASDKKLNFSNVYIPVEISFRNCVFEDSVVAFRDDRATRIQVSTAFERNVSFLECDFQQALCMSQTDFRGRMDFDISKVQGEADFSGAHFRSGTSFCMANFNSDTYFVSCNFEGRCNFMKVFFRDAAVFQYVRFQDAVMFADAHFYGGVDFSKVFALNVVDFANSKFAGNVTLAYSQFLGDLRMIAVKYSGNLNMLGNTFLGQLNMEKAQFGSSLLLADNSFFNAPSIGGAALPDSCRVEQKNNKFADFDVKQLF